MKRISAIIAALMLIAALFAGCGLPAEILRVEPTEEPAASAETEKKTKKEKKESGEPTVRPDKKTKKGEAAVHETEAPEEALPSVPDALYIGYDPDYPPFTYDGGSRVEGFEADLAIAVCESLGIEPVFVPIMTIESRNSLL